VARDWEQGRPYPPTRVALLRTAHWRAARDGLAGRLVHPGTAQLVPAAEAVQALLDVAADALDDVGDRPVVAALVEQVLGRGTGATAQRKAFHRRASLADVARMAAEHTSPA